MRTTQTKVIYFPPILLVVAVHHRPYLIRQLASLTTHFITLKLTIHQTRRVTLVTHITADVLALLHAPGHVQGD